MPDRHSKIEALAIKANHSESLLAIPGVHAVGTGRGGDGYFITVWVTKITPESSAKIPSELDGFPVLVRENAKARAGLK